MEGKGSKTKGEIKDPCRSQEWPGVLGLQQTLWTLQGPHW